MIEGEHLNNLHNSFELINQDYWQVARKRLMELLEERLSLLDFDVSKDPNSVIIDIKSNQIANKIIMDWVNIIESEAKSWVIENKKDNTEEYIKTIS